MNVVSKSELMAHVIAGEARECFEHSTEGVFDISAIRQAIKEKRIPWNAREVTLDQIIPFIKENRVIDPERVKALDWKSWDYDLGIFITCEDGSHMLADGTHRALRREAEGMETMWFYFIDMKHAIRPTHGWGKNPNYDWGDELIDGKIVKRREV